MSFIIESEWEQILLRLTETEGIRMLQLYRPGPGWGGAEVECGRALVLGGDGLHHPVHRLAPEQCHGAAPEPAPGHAAPEHPGHRERRLHQHVQLGARDLEVVPEDDCLTLTHL